MSGRFLQSGVNNSLRQSNAAHQVLEARLGAQGVEPRLYFESHKTERRMLLVSSFEPCDCLITLTQARIEKGYPVRILRCLGP